jgi:hypothetical protein
MMLLRVSNPLPLERDDVDDARAGHAGHGMALENIRERLELLHGAKASVKTGRDGDEFVVELRFPVVEATPGKAG